MYKLVPRVAKQLKFWNFKKLEKLKNISKH